MDKVKLLHGDCLELMKDIPDKSIDLILTDPPYGTTACKWDSVIPFEPMWEQLNRIIKPNGAICLFGSEPFSSALRMSNIKHYKYDWIWEKSKASGHLNAKIMPLKAHEIISVFSKRRCNYYPQGLKDVYRIQNKKDSNTTIGNGYSTYGKHNKTTIQTVGNYPRSVLKFSKPNKPTHPTQKPVALLEYLIKTYTNEGEVVLDNTMGSGSTGVAALNTGRKFIGIELNDKYFEIAKERLENHEVQNNE
ncbi:MAG: site-specific DNA-methyltransferase [Bacteroidales bacterium]|nr:site-specific DNA-methyltransferase [Bacteroidales bacterium]